MSILVNTGFKVGGAEPLNEYSIRETVNDRDALVTNGYVYEGMEVYCKDTKIKYRWDGAAWNILDNAPVVDDGDVDTTVIFDKNIDTGKYFLLAKITDANYATNILKFSCPNFKGANQVGFRYEDDMDILKFELHFNTGSRNENSNRGVTLKQHGLGLYSYPLDNPKNTSPEIKDAVRLYWNYNTSEIYVFLVDLTTAIPHCCLEYTGSGTLLKDNTFISDNLYNWNAGSSATWEESKWKSIPYNKLETPPIYELGGNGGSTEGTKTYTSLDELGLTADTTVEDVVNALKKGESFLAPVSTFTNYETIFPSKLPNDQWNKVHIIKGSTLPNSYIRCYSQSGQCEYLANVNNTNIVSWNDVSGTYIDISDATIEKLGNEILKYPVGRYRINSTTTGDKFTDLPSNAETKCGLIEINGTAVGKSPFTDTWVYRMYKFECLTGSSSYIRRLNSGGTVGQIETDTGWCKEGRDIYTSLSELGLTAPVSVGDIFNAMPNKTMAVINCEGKEGNTEGSTVTIKDVPVSFGVLTIKKNEVGRFSLEYQNSLQSSACNVKKWIGTLKGIDGTGLVWKQLSTQTNYTQLWELGLTADATVQNVIDVLPVGYAALLRTDSFTNWSTLFNNIQYGYLKIEKGANNLSNIELQDVITPSNRYFGKQAGGKFHSWYKVITDASRITALEAKIAALEARLNS